MNDNNNNNRRRREEAKETDRGDRGRIIPARSRWKKKKEKKNEKGNEIDAETKNTRRRAQEDNAASSMLRFRNSFDASQVLFLVLPLFVLVGIVPELPLPRAEYHVEGGAGDVNAGRDHEDEPPLRLSRLKNGKREME